MKTNSAFLLSGGVWVSLVFALLESSLRAAPIESNLKRSFAVNPGGNLIVDADSGSIEITTGDLQAATIEVKRSITGADDTKAQEIFTAHEVTFDQDGDRVE